MSQKLSADLKRAVIEAFDEIDVERAGRLDKDDFRKVLQLIGQNPTRAEVKKYFKEGREYVNRDDVCDFVEKKVMFKSQAAIDDEIANAFSKFDTSENSLISVADFKEILTKIGDEPLTEAEADLIIKSLDVKDHLKVADLSKLLTG